MYSAWLEVASGEWHRTTNHTEVLDHSGSFIVCDDENEDSLITEKILAESGKFAAKRSFGRIILSDRPIFDSLTDEAQKLAIAGVPCSLGFGTAENTFWLYGFNVETLNGKNVQWYCGTNLEKQGFVVVNGNELRYDLALWQKCKNLKTRRERENQQINRHTLEIVANKLAKNMGMSEIKSFCIEQFIVWVFTHDQFFGRRATNKEIRWLAKSWSENPKSYRKHFKRWVNETILDKLEKRFRSVVKTE